MLKEILTAALAIVAAWLLIALLPSLFEVGIGQAPAVEEILAQNGYQDIQSAQDTQGIWRVVEGTARD